MCLVVLAPVSNSHLAHRVERFKPASRQAVDANSDSVASEFHNGHTDVVVYEDTFAFSAKDNDHSFERQLPGRLSSQLR